MSWCEKVRVSVQGINGEPPLELDVETESTVSKLKMHLTTHFPIPPIFQELLLGTTTMCDDEQIDKYLCNDCGALAITFLVTTQVAIRLMQTGSEETKVQVLQDLAKLHGGGTNQIEVAATGLEDNSPAIRQAAIETLSLLGKRGKLLPQAIASVVERLGSPVEEVKVAALEALREVASKWDDGTINCIIPYLKNPSPAIRERVATLLGQVAQEGDQDTISALAGRLEPADTCNYVRRAALQALIKIVLIKGDQNLIHTVAKRLEDDDIYVRRWAVEALVAITDKGDTCAITAIAKYLEHPNDDVRSAGEVALTMVAETNDAYALMLMNELAKHPDMGVRVAAVSARSVLSGRRFRVNLMHSQ